MPRLAQLKRINPELQLETLALNGPIVSMSLLSRHKIVVNGMDDVAAGIALYRKAREPRRYRD